MYYALPSAIYKNMASYPTPITRIRLDMGSGGSLSTTPLERPKFRNIVIVPVDNVSMKM